MLSAALLHLHLNLTVARVNIIEEFLSGLSCIFLDFRIQVLVDMDKAALLANLQPEVIQGGKLVAYIHLLYGSLQG